MSNDIYNTLYWSDGYFQLNESGDLCVCDLDRGGDITASVPFSEVLTQLKARGLRWPVLVRFTHILKDRVFRLHQAFREVMDREAYQAKFVAAYPIKVNQQHNVVEQIIQCHNPENAELVGLEAGSKPELLAVLALVQSKQSPIICNGYKDRAYMRLALLGMKLGYQVTIVIEKLSELEQVLEEAQVLGVKPILGVRVRLSAQGKGKWQNSGGEGSKFGLSSKALLKLVDKLQVADSLDCLTLLHFHMGSQISNIQDIKKCTHEATRYFLELVNLGAPVAWMDVGGGLGVDYEGTSSRNFCSMNYGLVEYAAAIVSEIKAQCEAAQVTVPNIISESGRALTAHHAVLLTQVMDIERQLDQTQTNIDSPSDEQKTEIIDLWNKYQATCFDLDERNILEMEYALRNSFTQIHDSFLKGTLDLKDRALAENYYYAGCENIRAQLKPDVKSHQQLIDELNEKLAENLFVNFSLFQSMPDAWGIDQIFPIMPLTGLNGEIRRRGRVQDITCDSDGRIRHYVDGMGVESTLPLPNNGFGKGDVLGMFLVGAYQEILGDMHNLFGDTDSVDVSLVSDVKGQVRLDLSGLCRGDTVEKVLNYVHFDAAFLLDRLESQVAEASLSAEDKNQLLMTFRASLQAYTYLESDS